jgi:hypothetical protein
MPPHRKALIRYALLNATVMKIKAFWDWFERCNADYYSVRDLDPVEKEMRLNVLLKKLHDYCDKLYFEVGGHPEGKQELIITAEGNTEYFEEVEKLVYAAPTLRNWTIIAFIPPREVDFKMTYEDITLHPPKMYFEPLEFEGDLHSIGIEVYIDNYKEVANSDWLTAAVNKILDTILGERSFAQDIAYVSIADLHSERDLDELIPLLKLPQFVSWSKLRATGGSNA